MATAPREQTRPGGTGYRLSVVRLDGADGAQGWRASVDDVPGCVGEGATPAAAVAAADAALSAWLEREREAGRDVEAAPAHSGRLLLRMPRALHAELARRADGEGESLNQYIVGTLARGLVDGPAGTGAGLPRAVRISLAVNAAIVLAALVVAVLLLTGAWSPS